MKSRNLPLGQCLGCGLTVRWMKPADISPIAVGQDTAALRNELLSSGGRISSARMHIR